MGKCRNTKGKARQLECYTTQTAKWTAGKLKSGISRIGSISGKQGSKHNYGFGLFLLAIIGIAAVAGGVYLLTVPVTNPTAASVPYVHSWTNSTGAGLLDNSKVSGTISCRIEPGVGAVTEGAKWTPLAGTIPVVDTSSMITPYYITGVILKVYAGSSATGTPLKIASFTPTSNTYISTMQSWVNSYAALINSNPADTSKWSLAATPAANTAWTVGFDTRQLANGIYTFQMTIIWGTSLTITIPVTIPGPPSLTSTSGNVYLLSLFGIGVLPEVPTDISLIILVAIVAVAVVVIVLKRRT